MLQFNNFRFFLLFSLSVSFSGLSQKGIAYKIYDSKGKSVSFKKMMKTLAKNDLVFFGELHDNSIAHWLEYEITAALYANYSLVL